MLLLKLPEFLFVANCWRANKIWSASTVAEVISLRNCGWLVERAFFCFPDEVPGERWGIYSSIPVTMWRYWRISLLALVTMWGCTSASGLFRRPEGWEEYPTSGQGSSEERSPVVSRFSELLFLNFPGTATEQVRNCGFRRNSSSLDRAPKMRDSVLLNSFESFLITLPPISLETREIYSGSLPESSVFCDWLLLVFSGVSLETAASFLLFLKVTMILREKFCQQWTLNWTFYTYIQQWWFLLNMREEDFKKG